MMAQPPLEKIGPYAYGGACVRRRGAVPWQNGHPSLAIAGSILRAGDATARRIVTDLHGIEDITLIHSIETGHVTCSATHY